MLNGTQERYLRTIPESKIVVIKPWDPKTRDIANKSMKDIQFAVPNLEVLHTGAVALEISGQNDIDFSILGKPEDFGKYLPNLIKVLGQPQKIGKENVRWEIVVEGYPVDVHLTDKDSQEIKEHRRVFELLQNNPQLLEEYKVLKEQSNSLSMREYQRKKYEFYNRILEEYEL